MTSGGSGERWTPEDLRHLASVRELQIATARAGKRWTPVWVVVVENEVFVRTWYRRDTGWYGRAVLSGRALIRVSGDPVAVIVEVTGETDARAVDAAYGTKYGASGAQSMITAEAAASTLRLTRAS